MQPLSGILVLDFTTLLPGPLATLMLAEAGAEVIKIERPEGEDMRAGAPRFDGEAAAFALLNRGKKGITLDLKNESDRNRLRPLLEKADVLVEQFRPGVMARLKLGFEDVRKINPRIVYCSISGYGQDGPRSGEAGHDINYQSLTGLLAIQPGPAEKPVIPPALIADIGGGTMPAVINILLGLRQRDATGQGVHLDIAMTDAMFTFAWYAWAFGHATGKFPGPGELRLVGASPRYQLYPTADDKIVACGALEQKFWLAFCNTIGLAGAADERYGRPGGHQGRGRGDHQARDRRALAAEIRRRRLLRHHHGLARRGAARSAFRRARAVRAQGCQRERRDHAGACRCRLPRRCARSRARRLRRSSGRTMICLNKAEQS